MAGAAYYLIENRQYVGYDATLAQGPYNFSEASRRPNWVEFYSFQDGMLVWLVDHAAADNNTSLHPGTGYALPVDATPNSLTYERRHEPDATGVEPFDATFGLDGDRPRCCLHKQVAADNELAARRWRPARRRSRGVATFDDTSDYYDESRRRLGEGCRRRRHRDRHLAGSRHPHGQHGQPGRDTLTG